MLLAQIRANWGKIFFGKQPRKMANASSFCLDKIFFVLDKTEIVQEKIFVKA